MVLKRDRGSEGEEKRKRAGLLAGGVQRCLWSCTLTGQSLQRRRRENLLLPPQELPASPRQCFLHKRALG